MDGHHPAKPEMLTKIPTYFSETYAADTPTASMAKLAPVARAAEQAGYVTFHDPGLVDLDKLRELHDPNYVRAIITGKGPLASAMGWEWTPQIRNGILAINAGQIAGAKRPSRCGRRHRFPDSSQANHATWVPQEIHR